MRGLERWWFCGEFRNFRWVLVFNRAGGVPTCLQTMKHWHSHWQKPATSILRSPRETYDRGSSCKIKCTWAFLMFFALRMWLTRYQVVDHVYYSESNLAKGMSLINDSLNTKVSPFSIHPSLPHIDSWARNPHHQSNTLINPSPKIYLRLIYPRTGYAKTASTRYDATSSYRITLDPLELP